MLDKDQNSNQNNGKGYRAGAGDIQSVSVPECIVCNEIICLFSNMCFIYGCSCPEAVYCEGCYTAVDRCSLCREPKMKTVRKEIRYTHTLKAYNPVVTCFDCEKVLAWNDFTDHKMQHLLDDFSCAKISASDIPYGILKYRPKFIIRLLQNFKPHIDPQRNYNNVRTLCDHHRNNGDFMLEALNISKDICLDASSSVTVFNFASNELKKDEEFVKKAMDITPCVYEFADHTIRSSKDFFIVLLLRESAKYSNIHNVTPLLQFAGRDIIMDTTIISTIYENDPESALKFADKDTLIQFLHKMTQNLHDKKPVKITKKRKRDGK